MELSGIKFGESDFDHGTIAKSATADQTINRITSEADDIAKGIAAAKERSMRYQADLKDEVGAKLGVPGESLDLPFEQWEQIRSAYLAGDTNKAKELLNSF